MADLFSLHIFKPSRTYLKIDLKPIASQIYQKSELPSNLRICQIFMKYKPEISLFHTPEEVQTEKERLSSLFIAFCQSIQPYKLFSYFDYLDPATGMLQISPSSCTFSDTDIAQTHLHFKLKPFGGCFLLDHPEFGINMSMGTFFFCLKLPEDEIKEALFTEFKDMMVKSKD